MTLNTEHLATQHSVSSSLRPNKYPYTAILRYAAALCLRPLQGADMGFVSCSSCKFKNSTDRFEGTHSARVWGSAIPAELQDIRAPYWRSQVLAEVALGAHVRRFHSGHSYLENPGVLLKLRNRFGMTLLNPEKLSDGEKPKT